MQMLAYSIIVVSCGLLYLSNRNQIWLQSPLSLNWRYLGYFLLALGAVLLLNVMTLSTAILSFCVLLMTTWGLLPFLGLIERNPKGDRHAG